MKLASGDPASGDLASVDRDRALAALPRWSRAAERDAIETEFVFADFNAAFAFMTRVAMLAERRDHHPEWSNVWNKVRVLLTTHDAGGVTQKDIDFAAAIEEWRAD